MHFATSRYPTLRGAAYIETVAPAELKGEEEAWPTTSQSRRAIKDT